MTWQQKSDLIQKDPVTCARNFEHMVQLLIKDALKSNLMPIGEIGMQIFYRIEFQQRGLAHIHALFWVEDASQYEETPNKEEYIICGNDELSDDMLRIKIFLTKCVTLGIHFSMQLKSVLKKKFI